MTVGSVGLLSGRPLTLPPPHSSRLFAPSKPSSLIKFTLFLGELATDDLGVSTILLAGKLTTVVSSSCGAATSLLETVVISSPLFVVMISVCFMKPVKISNRSSSDILGLVAGKGVVGVTAGKGVVNRLKAGRLLLFLVV